MAIIIDDKSKCCGCTACYNACPKHCIKMCADDEGFLYPRVDAAACINCNVCEQICLEKKGYIPLKTTTAYAVRNQNAEILSRSTSGGAFSAFAYSCLERGGYVYGAVFDKDKVIRHIEIHDDKEAVKLFRGSKYVQSELGEIFSVVKKRLDNNDFVLFSGTSCQIAGLRNYLRHNYENLLTIEVICHGVPSPKLWKLYVEHQEKKNSAVISSVNFRNKTYGYHSGTMSIEFDNGKHYYGSARVDLMLKSFFSEISSRPSCYSCICKGTDRPADISIFDCWHADQLVDGLSDDDRGYTNLLVNSSKGMLELERCRTQLEINQIDLNKAIALDGIMITKQPVPHHSRESFYHYLSNHSIDDTVREYIAIKPIDYLIERIKWILHKTHILRSIKRVLKHK